MSSFLLIPPQLSNIDSEVNIWHTNIDCWQSVAVPVFWRLLSTYVTLLQLSEGMVDKAKGIFYKALQHIPWVKVSWHSVLATSPFDCSCETLIPLILSPLCFHIQGLFLDGVKLFPEQMQEFVDLMTEKELRLRLPLEELDILLE